MTSPHPSTGRHTTMRPRLALLGPLLLAGLSLPAVTASSSYAADATCQGLPATVTGDGATLTGTEGADVIVASGATTLIDALGGDDTICAFAAYADNVLVSAGAGDDHVLVTGGSGGGYSLRRTTTDLGPGDDTYTGWEGAENVDTPVSARLGADTISTGGGTDFVGSGAPGEPNRDVVDLGDGQDVLSLTLPPGSAMAATSRSRGGALLRLDDTGAGVWAVDLRGRTGTVTHDVPAELARLIGFTDLDVELPNAARLDVRGNGETNKVTLSPTPRRLRADLRSGHDVLTLDDVDPGTRGRVTLGGQRGDAAFLSSTQALALAIGARRVPGRFTLDVTHLGATAPRLDVLGSGRAESIDATSCRTVVDARAGDDVVGADAPGREEPFSCAGATVGPDQVVTYERLRGARLLGGAGNDILRGSRLDDVLVGGPGRDRALGRMGDDTCRAEIARRC